MYESFILSSKDRMIMVAGDNNAYIFKQPLIESFNINYSNNMETLHYLGGKSKLVPGVLDISAEIHIRMLGLDHQSGTKLKPEDFYSLPELIRMSKMITRKIKV